jgi:hypothetical protein
MCLSDRDHQERPAVDLQRAPDDCLPVAQPCPMDKRTPAPATVLPLAVNDFSAARTQFPICGKPRRPDLSDEFFHAPKAGPLLI